MRCCEACFEDLILKDHIQRHGRRGACGYCRARKHFVIEASELEELFIRFTDIYSPVALGENVPPDADVLQVGEPLATLIQEEWEIFSERLTASAGTTICFMRFSPPIAGRRKSSMRPPFVTSGRIEIGCI